MDHNLYLLNDPQILPFQKLPLPQGTMIVGRSSENALYVPDITVSRRHAEVTVNGGKVTIRDLDSRNGTFLGNERIGFTAIGTGQRVRFGRVSFVLSQSHSSQMLADVEFETETHRGPVLSREAKLLLAKLSEARCRVFDWLVEGNTEKKIAEVLGLSPHTVHSHVREIFQVFDVHSKAELIAKCTGNP
ncbi:MAG: FHA domain-containing protein [Planctomycetales bacterium]